MTDTDSSNNQDKTVADEPKGGHPGPVDEGKDGGMATRELAPEITEEDSSKNG